jgi:DNA repair protein SbcC/Rad50
MNLVSISLKNFMIHQKLKIEFSPYITGIIGDSGTGKSTIFRAIKLITKNRPKNQKKLITKGKTDFKIKLTTTNHIITRTLKKYSLLNLETKEKQIFKAFGTDVPNPIKEALNINDLNWQNQHAEHFLIFQGSSQAAKFLEKSFGNKDAKKLIEKTKEKISGLKSEYKLNLSNKTDYENIITKLKPIKELRYLVNESKEFMKSIDNNNQNINELKNLIEKLENIKFIKKTTIKETQKMIENSINTIESIEENEKQIDELTDILDKIERNQIINNNLISKIYKNFVEANSVFEKKEKLENEISNLEDILDVLENLADILEDYSEEIKSLEKEIHKHLKELKNCPLCGAKQ